MTISEKLIELLNPYVFHLYEGYKNGFLFNESDKDWWSDVVDRDFYRYLEEVEGRKWLIEVLNSLPPITLKLNLTLKYNCREQDKFPHLIINDKMVRFYKR